VIEGNYYRPSRTSGLNHRRIRGLKHSKPELKMQHQMPFPLLKRQRLFCVIFILNGM